MGLEGRPVGAGQGHVGKVIPGVEVTERGGHVHREVVPLQAVLLGATHLDKIVGCLSSLMLTRLSFGIRLSFS